MRKIVIADTSCLIVFQKINRLSILKEMFEEISITQEIADEYGDKLPEWIRIKKVIDKSKQRILHLVLDKGEASALALGIENENSLILIDEKKGRQKATELGLKIMGTLGVLIKAKEKKLIGSLLEEIEQLKNVGFRMSDKLIENILNNYDEIHNQ